MDVDTAIANFLASCHRFEQLLFVTDEELERLFGRELVMTINRLERFNQEESVCLQCGGSCCHDIGCELYLPRFGRCPIHGFRPIACRLHFCHRFDAVDKSLVLALRNTFLGVFNFVEESYSTIFKLLDTPPLAGSSAEFVATIFPLITAVGQGSLEPEQAEKTIQQAVRDYRRSHRGGRQHGQGAVSFHAEDQKSG